MAELGHAVRRIQVRVLLRATLSPTTWRLNLMVELWIQHLLERPPTLWSRDKTRFKLRLTNVVTIPIKKPDKATVFPPLSVFQIAANLKAAVFEKEARTNASRFNTTGFSFDTTRKLQALKTIGDAAIEDQAKLEEVCLKVCLVVFYFMLITWLVGYS